jgi:nucleotide-binding universal stress UspA family protein
MPGIVCAIRGGPSSQPTIDRAIALANQHGLPLHFLYVVNLDFLAHTSTSRVQALAKEMRQMGEFILLTAQDRARSRGVTAEGDVRQGEIADEIIALSQELGADYVVLGTPQAETEANVFTQNRMEMFSKRIQEESGATVVMVVEKEQT